MSSLSKVQIADIFQQFLDRHQGGGNAVERICNFLGEDEFEDVVLNSGNTQRIMLIAANFRREITAAALWLMGHGIRTQCFTVKPFLNGSDLFLDIRQIIPVALHVATQGASPASVRSFSSSRSPLRLELSRKTSKPPVYAQHFPRPSATARRSGPMAMRSVLLV